MYISGLQNSVSFILNTNSAINYNFTITKDPKLINWPSLSHLAICIIKWSIHTVHKIYNRNQTSFVSSSENGCHSASLKQQQQITVQGLTSWLKYELGWNFLYEHVTWWDNFLYEHVTWWDNLFLIVLSVFSFRTV